MKRRMPGGFLDRSSLKLKKPNPKTKKLYKRRGHKLDRKNKDA